MSVKTNCAPERNIAPMLKNEIVSNRHLSRVLSKNRETIIGKSIKITVVKILGEINPYVIIATTKKITSKKTALLLKRFWVWFIM